MANSSLSATVFAWFRFRKPSFPEAKSLGKEWNDEVREAWINCYAILSGTMITVAGK